MEQPFDSSAIAPHVPVMTKLKFSELTCVPEGVVEGWLDRGYVPSLVIGKHRLVNVALMFKQALDQQSYL
jgi:hypothetical protein